MTYLETDSQKRNSWWLGPRRDAKFTVRRVSILIGIAALSALANGCATGPAPHQVTIHVTTSVIDLHRTAEGASFSTVVLVRNRGSSDIWLGECGPELQKRIGNQWSTVWTPVCVSGTARWSVTAGDTALIPVTIVGYTTPAWYPRLDDRVGPGLYRLIYFIRTAAASSVTPAEQREEMQPSTTFILREISTQ